MYKSCIIMIAAIILFAEAGVVTNTFDPKLDTSQIDTKHNLKDINNVSTHLRNYKNDSIPSSEYIKARETEDKLVSSNESWLVKNVPQIISEDSNAYFNKSSKNDVMAIKNTGDNLELTVHGDKNENQEINHNVFGNLELELYPNLFDQKPLPIRNISNDYQTDPGDRIDNYHGNNTISEKIGNKTNLNKILSDKYKTDTDSKKQNDTTTISGFSDTNIMKTSVKFNDKIVPDVEKDFDESFYANIEDLLESITDYNLDYFEMDEDIFIEDPRYKRSANIIEEENSITTESMSKYTGRQGILNNDFYFKNIHS